MKNFAYLSVFTLLIFILSILSVQDTYAANTNLFVSAENEEFGNYMSGPQVIEVIVIDTDINSTTQSQGEPDVTINGKTLRMVQAVDGNWYGYFADKLMAQVADETVRSSGVSGYGLDFGVLCNGGSLFDVFFDANALALPRSDGLNNYVDGTNLIVDCNGSPTAGLKLNKVLRETPDLNTNPNLPIGQIGIDPDAWPFIQLYTLNPGGNVVVQYHKGGDVQATTLTFDTVNQFANFQTFQNTFRPGNQVKFSLTDIQLNIDPTDEDSWTFGTLYNSGMQTRYQLFDENGNTDAVCALGNPTCSIPSDFGSGSPDIIPSLPSLMFEENGILEINLNVNGGPPIIDFRDNADQIFDVLNGNIPQPVTVVETSKNSGTFVNYDESNLANLYVLQNASLGMSGTINYNDSPLSVVARLVPTQFTAIQDGDWDDPATWGTINPPTTVEWLDDVMIPSGKTVTIPLGLTVSNAGRIQNYGNLINEGTLNNSATFYNAFSFRNVGVLEGIGTFTFAAGITDISGIFDVNSGGSVLVVGSGIINILSDGILNNSGSIDNQEKFNNSGTINNFDTITNSDSMNNNLGGIFNNENTVNNNGFFNNFAIFNNHNVLTNSNSFANTDTLVNSLSGIIINNDGSIRNKGSLINHGTIQINTGALFNDDDDPNNFIATLDNFGTINNNSGWLINTRDTMSNSGTINNSGRFDNTGLLNNSGFLTNNLSGIISNYNTAIINNSGTINNFGTLNNFGGAVIKLCGGTYDGIPQVGNSIIDLCDADSDGYTTDGSGLGLDCNDNDSSIFLGATEIANDGIDQDCDGQDLVVPIEVTLNADKDSFMRKGTKNTNEGDNTILMVQKAGNKRTLVSFDLSDYENQQVSSATLRLYITYNGGNWGNHNDRMIEVHKLLSNWVEGNGANFIPKNLDEDNEPTKNKGTGSGVTWACSIDSNISNKKSDCVPKWNGGNFDGAITDSGIITSITSGWIEFDVTSDVNSIITGYADNFGWLIKKSNENNSGRIAFASGENAEQSHRPQLVLNGLHPQTTPPPGL